MLRWLYRNIVFAIVAPIIGGVLFHTLAGAAHLATGGAFNYEKASEKRQQVWLESIGAGLGKGFSMATGNAVRIEHEKASAAEDRLSFDVRYVDPGLDAGSYSAFKGLKSRFLQVSCTALAMQNALGQGVTIAATLKRPSGQPFAHLYLDKKSCAGFP